MRFPGDNGIDKQDPRISPGVIFDQSEILSKKYGLRTSYTHQGFPDEGLELRFGIDVVHDQTQQFLALTNRVWVPPMNYLSFGPYVQLSYDIGPVTLSGGWRHEDGKVKVDDYTTTYYRNSVFVQGGKINYKEDLFNAGAILRIGSGFSAFATYGEGFTLPNFGIPLRNVNVPNQSVESLLPDLQAVIFKNKEVGFNWRGSMGSFGLSYYQSRSETRRRPCGRSDDQGLRDQPSAAEHLRLRLQRGVPPDRHSTAECALQPHHGQDDDRERGHLPDQCAAGDPQYRARQGQRIDHVAVRSRLRPSSFGATGVISRNLPAIKEYTHGYVLFDMTANLRVPNVATVSFGVENLLNKFYFLQSSQIDIYQNYFAGRGRVVSVTLRRDF